MINANDGETVSQWFLMSSGCFCLIIWLKKKEEIPGCLMAFSYDWKILKKCIKLVLSPPSSALSAGSSFVQASRVGNSSWNRNVGLGALCAAFLSLLPQQRVQPLRPPCPEEEMGCGGVPQQPTPGCCRSQPRVPKWRWGLGKFRPGIQVKMGEKVKLSSPRGHKGALCSCSRPELSKVNTASLWCATLPSSCACSSIVSLLVNHLGGLLCYFFEGDDDFLIIHH